MEQGKLSSEYGKSLDDIEVDLEGGYSFVSFSSDFVQRHNEEVQRQLDNTKFLIAQNF